MLTTILDQEFVFAARVDELGVTVGIAEIRSDKLFGGTMFSVYKNLTATVEIRIPKWAYAGIAPIQVDAFNIDPSLGGVRIARATRIPRSNNRDTTVLGQMKSPKTRAS
jgi:hypothetical protein